MYSTTTQVTDRVSVRDGITYNERTLHFNYYDPERPTQINDKPTPRGMAEFYGSLSFTDKTSSIFYCGLIAKNRREAMEILAKEVGHEFWRTEMFTMYESAD